MHGVLGENLGFEEGHTEGEGINRLAEFQYILYQPRGPASYLMLSSAQTVTSKGTISYVYVCALGGSIEVDYPTGIYYYW